MSDQEQTVLLFDELADSYDAVGVDFFQPIGSGLVAALSPQPGERALDVGCGRGAVLFPLAAAVGTSGSVTGLDVSPKMVQATIDDVSHTGLDIVVQLGDAMAPAFPAASFDLVTSSLVLFFLPEPLAALRSWRNLLAERGRLGVSTFGPEDERWAQNVEEVLLSHATAKERDAHSDYESGPFMSDEGMEQLLADAGFTNIRTVTSVVSPRFTDSNHWFQWSMSVGQRQFWQSLSGAAFEEAKAIGCAAVEGCRDQQGRIGFDQVVRYTLGDR